MVEELRTAAGVFFAPNVKDYKFIATDGAVIRGERGATKGKTNYFRLIMEMPDVKTLTTMTVRDVVEDWRCSASKPAAIAATTGGGAGVAVNEKSSPFAEQQGFSASDKTEKKGVRYDKVCLTINITNKSIIN